MVGIGLTNLPTEMAAGVWKNATAKSVLARLSQQEPQQFGNVQYMSLTSRPKAQFVGSGSSGGRKQNSGGAFGTKVVSPVKAQVTMRFDEELQWADEDRQLGALQMLADEGAAALSRALDLGGLFGLDPLTGTRYTAITEFANQTANRAEINMKATTGTPAVDPLVNSVGAIIANGYTPNGVALDTGMAFNISQAKNAQGSLLYPNLGFGVDMTSFLGMNAAVSSTVSGRPDVADQKTRAFVGDFSAFRWGVQKNIGLRTITAGDPDSTGVDLGAANQVAIRLEVVYGMAWMDLGAIAVVEDKVADA